MYTWAALLSLLVFKTQRVTAQRFVLIVLDKGVCRRKACRVYWLVVVDVTEFTPSEPSVKDNQHKMYAETTYRFL